MLLRKQMIFRASSVKLKLKPIKALNSNIHLLYFQFLIPALQPKHGEQMQFGVIVTPFFVTVEPIKSTQFK